MGEGRVNGGFIGDGFTMQHCIAASEFHEEVNIEFRPCSPPEVARVRRNLKLLDEKNDTDGIESIAADLICSKVKNWDLRNHAGAPVEVTKENCLDGLEVHLSGAIFDVLIGSVPAVAMVLSLEM